MSPARAVATLCGIGLLRPAPGTWGSIAALPPALLLHLAGGPWLLCAGIGVAAALGLWATARVTAGAEDPDRPEIVIDELAGQWIALLPVSAGASLADAAILDLWPGWLAAFALFRLFDVWKPGPVGWADRRHDAAGVMLDDLIAGVFAALGVIALGVAYHVAILP